MANAVYVTSNSHKFADAEKYLKEHAISIEQKTVELVEIQSDSIEEVALDKARKAFETLKQPLFVNDSGWYISALNGFPGPFMAYVSKWFSAEDFIKLMDGHQNREIIIRQVIVFKDENGEQVFAQDNIGKVLDEVKGEGRPIDCVSTFLDSGLSIAEAKEQGIFSVDESGLWGQLAAFLNKKS